MGTETVYALPTSYRVRSHHGVYRSEVFSRVLWTATGRHYLDPLLVDRIIEARECKRRGEGGEIFTVGGGDTVEHLVTRRPELMTKCLSLTKVRERVQRRYDTPCHRPMRRG